MRGLTLFQLILLLFANANHNCHTFFKCWLGLKSNIFISLFTALPSFWVSNEGPKNTHFSEHFCGVITSVTCIISIWVLRYIGHDIDFVINQFFHFFLMNISWRDTHLHFFSIPGAPNEYFFGEVFDKITIFCRLPYACYQWHSFGSHLIIICGLSHYSIKMSQCNLR